MEVLNKNQRDSAVWRLFGLGVIVVAIILAILFAMHKQYSGQGLGELEKCIRERQDSINLLLGQKQEEVNKNNALNTKIKELEAKIKNPDEADKIRDATLENMEKRISFLENDLEIKDRELNQCKNNLAAFQSNKTNKPPDKKKRRNS